MIIATISEVNGGEYLATFGVKIARSMASEMVVFENCFVKSEHQFKFWAKTRLKNFIKKTIKSFLSQRKTALMKVGMLNSQFDAGISGMLRITEIQDLETTMRFVLSNQDKLRLFLPSKDSQHYYWSSVIEEIIHFSHEYLAGDKKLWN